MNMLTMPKLFKLIYRQVDYKFLVGSGSDSQLGEFRNSVYFGRSK